MSWLHSVSPDLLHWSEPNIALLHEPHFMCYSGSAVLREDKMYLIYTMQMLQGGKYEAQGLAMSEDYQTFTQFVDNPVLSLEKQNFRDPNVFRYKDSFYMVIALPIDRKLLFFQSDNLQDWKPVGEFSGYGDRSGIWECPDLIEFGEKWILLISLGTGYEKFSTVQYMIGVFNGTHFIPDSPKYWLLDEGPDYYAAVSYHNQKVSIGWMANWVYADKLPTGTIWRGQMALPRQLKLSNDGSELLQTPLSQLSSLYQSEIRSIKDKRVKGEIHVGNCKLCVLNLTVSNCQNGFELKLRSNLGHEYTKLRYSEGLFTMDRSHSGQIQFIPENLLSFTTSRPVRERNTVDITIVLDWSSIEFFAEKGRHAMTMLVYPLDKNSNSIEFIADSGEVVIKDLSLTTLKSSIAW